MKHKTMEELLSAYYDHELTAEQTQLVERHLRECIHCREAMAAFQNASDALRSAADFELAPMFTANVLRTIRLEKEEEGSWFSAVSVGRRLVWALGVVSVVIVGTSALNQPESPLPPEVYFTSEPVDSSVTRTLLQKEELSKDDIIIAALID